MENNTKHGVKDQIEVVLHKEDVHNDDTINITAKLPANLMTSQKQHPSETASRDSGKEAAVESMGSHHPRDLRKGRKGDDGTNIKAKLQENSILKSLGRLMGHVGTSRKMVNLTNEAQAERDKEIIEEHMKSHRVH